MKLAAYAALLALSLVAPFLFYPVFLMQALCMAIFASAFNLLFGYVGLLSFGHAAFFGSAAYIAGYAVKDLGLSPELAIIAGAGVGAALGFLIGGLAVRRQGIYFAMITFALAEIVYFVCIQTSFTGGENGLQSVPRGRLFSIIDLENDFVMYYFVLCIFLGSTALIYRIVHSPFGRAIAGIRGNETRAVSLGYRVEWFKIGAFVLSAALAGVAGATKTIVMHFASLTDVHWHMSGEVVLMTLLGGLGTMTGPPIGALLVVTLSEFFAGLGDWVTFVIGAIFVACVLGFREGIVGAASRGISSVKGQWQARSYSGIECPAAPSSFEKQE